ncbi:hypothetical protein BN14_07453 [Rhizoctonia solani AG-1 IB]|uniref:NB-ARC domain-containing protein n=1 Tax=Thanatephorus cucumeris (strain AG1-IB / isolate 7/3/14) TaxID=1108050 RepID=M5C0B4_THACB|nr:hypothetical protein BN14_07453 [Rhizoctonia solani AG-1 IB]
MKGIAEDAEKVAEVMARRFSSANRVYYRLSVDQGMQSVDADRWDQRDEVAEHTRAYMRMSAVMQAIDKAAESIKLRKQNLSTSQIDGVVQVNIPHVSDLGTTTMIRSCPTPSPFFTGHKSELRRTESCIVRRDAGQNVCVVYGLGGSGKTQMVLKVIEITRSKWEEVVYIDASTQQSIHNELKDVAIVKRVGDTHHSALQWLESNRIPWLLVYDNADDSSVPMRDYIPRCSHGSLIITTRLPGMASLARGPSSECRMSSMEPEDALTLLLKCARRLDIDVCSEELGNAKALVQELDYFALAVVHAGSFIGHSPHMSVTEYRSLLHDQQQKALEAYSNLASAVKVDDYPHTVYTAWAMCYNAISPPAQELLCLMAYLHHTGITVDIFRRAATTIMSYKPKLPTTPSEDSALRKLRALLGPLITSDQVWDGLQFTRIIGEVVSRSLLEYDRMNQAYRMHQLVQSWDFTIGVGFRLCGRESGVGHVSNEPDTACG